MLQALVENRGEPLEIDGMPDSGLIDCAKALTAVSETMPYLPDTSDIELLCTPSEYSASSLAHAVEDADANILSLLTRPEARGMLRVYLRISHSDPSAAIHSWNDTDTSSTRRQDPPTPMPTYQREDCQN